MSSIELKSRAKINLSIDVLGKREDGYHLVEMIMQTIDLYDIIKIKEIEIDEININSNSSDIPLNENNIVLTIEDNGVGISEKDIDRVFEKGFTGENGRKFGKSTWIGLYLCKKLCDKLGIGINLTSKEGLGTKVNIVFPQGKFTDF